MDESYRKPFRQTYFPFSGKSGLFVSQEISGLVAVMACLKESIFWVINGSENEDEVKIICMYI